MQREKLFNRQCKAYANCVFLVQNKQYSEQPILDVAKKSPRELCFFSETRSEGSVELYSEKSDPRFSRSQAEFCINC